MCFNSLLARLWKLAQLILGFAVQKPEAGQHTVTSGELHSLAGALPPQQAEAPVQTWPDGHAPASTKQLWRQTAAPCEL